MKNKTKMLAGFKHIVDDGDCEGHGYIIPKQIKNPIKKINEGIALVNLSKKKLQKFLKDTSTRQTKMLKKAGLL